VQIASPSPPCGSAPARRWASGATSAATCSTGHRFSAREVGQFGAPSLITRITNDVQQVQQLVVLATTMMIAAPLTMVIGLVMAIREDVGAVGRAAGRDPAAVVVLGLVICDGAGVPADAGAHRPGQRVLREQITGIRVVRAFVREPQETARFAHANADLTSRVAAGRPADVDMFPTVTLIVNASSLAVLWVGADRIAAGRCRSARSWPT
jgi:ATP-binding cassette, subfamily B, multidrug efflux pump